MKNKKWKWLFPREAVKYLSEKIEQLESEISDVHTRSEHSKDIAAHILNTPDKADTLHHRNWNYSKKSLGGETYSAECLKVNADGNLKFFSLAQQIGTYIFSAVSYSIYKNEAAALTSVYIKGLLESWIEFNYKNITSSPEHSLKECILYLNNKLCEKNITGHFMEVILFLSDADSGRTITLSAGSQPVWKYSKNTGAQGSSLQKIEIEHCPPIGLMDNIFIEKTLQLNKLLLEREESLIVYYESMYDFFDNETLPQQVIEAVFEENTLTLPQKITKEKTIKRVLNFSELPDGISLLEKLALGQLAYFYVPQIHTEYNPDSIPLVIPEKYSKAMQLILRDEGMYAFSLHNQNDDEDSHFVESSELVLTDNYPIMFAAFQLTREKNSNFQEVKPEKPKGIGELEEIEWLHEVEDLEVVGEEIEDLEELDSP